ncbi:MAG: pilus assembly protein [Methylobacterium sp.]|uniref:TadE/TadG family type IV pilus assembly protein n=1 Tax=Methylobacterium sp. TaxID=409 RepID=UPI0025DC735A|nr:TadE/TadG family type IV pilus assembly protein [Methylobacterium sp.]MBX9929945.1 pilus assembly protein [Methylobacterium sp.]
MKVQLSHSFAAGFGRPTVALDKLRRCQGGVAALEFGIIAGPLVMLIVAVLQFIVYQYTQNLLNNALYDSAAIRETAITSNNKTGYKTAICNKIVIMATAQCATAIIVEMQPLQDVSKTSSPITDGPFTSGTVAQVILLRAILPVTQFVPFIPAMNAKASVVFRR